jgi:hypothetical protein
VGADVDTAELANTTKSLRAEGATTVLAAGASPGTPGIDVHLSPGADLVVALNRVLDGLEVSA